MVISNLKLYYDIENIQWSEYYDKITREKTQELIKQQTVKRQKTIEKFIIRLQKMTPRYCEICQKMIFNMTQHKTTKGHEQNQANERCVYCSTDEEVVFDTTEHRASIFHMIKSGHGKTSYDSFELKKLREFLRQRQ